MKLLAFLDPTFDCIRAGKPFTLSLLGSADVKYSALWWNILLCDRNPGRQCFFATSSDLTSESDNLCQGSDFLFLSCPWCHPSLSSRTVSFPTSPYTCSKKWPCDTTLSNCMRKKLCWRFGARVSFSEWGHSDSGTLSLTANLEFWCDAWIWAAILQPWGTRPKRKTKSRTQVVLYLSWWTRTNHGLPPAFLWEENIL